MGLDLLDIAYRIENEFELKIDPSDLEQIARNGDITVGALFELILAKLHYRERVQKSVQVNFEFWREMRATIRAATGIPVDSIELGVPLATLFPKPSRAALWSELQSECPYIVPPLEYPTLVKYLGFALALTMLAIEFFQWWRFAAIAWLGPVLWIVALLILGETYFRIVTILRPWRNAFPAGLKTVKDLCRSVLKWNFQAVCQGDRIASAKMPLDDRCLIAWEKLTKILVDALGVAPSDITFRARLAGDLGMG